MGPSGVVRCLTTAFPGVPLSADWWLPENKSNHCQIMPMSASRHERPFHNRALRLGIMQLNSAPPRPPLDHYLKPY